MKKQKSNEFSHIDESGSPRMVDISDKRINKRTAIAESSIELGKTVMSHLKEDEIHTKKGPVFQTAIIAGIMAAKKTHELIPMCHPLSLDHCSIKIEVKNEIEVIVTCKVITDGKTGVEMEALTGSSLAALTIYDMCKSISKSIIIKETRLKRKTGGKSDFSAIS